MILIAMQRVYYLFVRRMQLSQGRIVVWFLSCLLPPREKRAFKKDYSAFLLCLK